MHNLRHLLVAFMLSIMGLGLFFGCRAWEPETVIVNNPPRVYIIGAPAETSGAYFHFHVYWYGVDDDGYVERYVWALTDTSVQDRDTSDDEEDSRFNPAIDISTLEIGNWTTRTDTVFDFRIEQGSRVQHDMTLHIVAVDDQGAFSRRPARLHFFSNALGNPRLRFYRDEIHPDNVFADYDTIGYGRPLAIRWAGTTPNLANYDPARLALIDTVNPPGQEPDGLLGFKWRLPQLDGCNPSVEDCWQPRRYQEATGESISYFDNISGLDNLNAGIGSAPQQRRLNAGTVRLMVNTIDIAGVEVQPANRALNIVVNYAPRVRVLGAGTDGPEASPFEQDQQYPYYIVYHGPASRPNPSAPQHPVSNPYFRYPFAEGDRIPDRAYVVFKALGWEAVDASGEPRDLLLDDYAMKFQGEFVATGYPGGGTQAATFSPTRSLMHQTNEPGAEWTAQSAIDISADTLGFQVGPFDYEVLMRSVDEHETRSQPAIFRFSANFPPCMQCIELANTTAQPTVSYTDPCGLSDPKCQGRDVLEIRDSDHDDFDPNDRFHLIQEGERTIWVNPGQNGLQFSEPPIPTGWYQIDGYDYNFQVFLHGKDHEKEHWPPGQVHRRIAAWKYQIDYLADDQNVIKDAAGAGMTDDIRYMSGFRVATLADLPNDPLPDNVRILEPIATDPVVPVDYRGAWALTVNVSVPRILMDQGPVAYWDSLLEWTDAAPRPDPEDQDAILAWQAQSEVIQAFTMYRLTTMQFSPAWVSAIALDQSRQLWRPLSSCYNYYFETRMPTLQGSGPRECGLFPPSGFRIQGQRVLGLFAAESELAEKHFDIHLFTQGEDAPFQPFDNGQPPFPWIGRLGVRGPWR